MRSVTLSAVKAGMTRLRDKGGASPESLYELTNGYVDASRSPTIRPGTRLDISLPAGTKGICAFQGKIHVFATTRIDPGSEKYVVNILKHPDTNFAGSIKKIHFAKPFLGFLYVVAEFDDASVWHYWLQSKAAWSPNTQYQVGDVVRPSTENGYLYRSSAINSPPAWTPNTQHAIGDAVQPTAANGFKYTVIEADGANPSTGDTEPTWPTTIGAQINEDDDQTTAKPVPPEGGTSGSPGGPRYDNLLGRT